MATLTAVPVQERRRFVRGELPPRVAIDLLEPRLSTNSINISEGGLCLRLEETLEVRSLVQLQITPPPATDIRETRSVHCTGRVSWVMQRLDLRDVPPFLFDIGIEFINPPRVVRQLFAPRAAVKLPAARGKLMASAVIRGRAFVPRLEHAPGPPGTHAGAGPGRPSRWHLIVSIDGVPCFSQHYPSEPAALAGWARFRRQQARAGKR